MTTNPASKIEVQHPPLARDLFGNLLAVPAGACAWSISRETTGRPREIRGSNKQRVRFPLEITTDELVELCGPGVYRIYALDEVGTLIAEDHVARWDLTPSSSREHRNASMDPTLALRPDRPSTAMATPSTDLRFALETMAQMMRTNSDALRLVAESQVDLAKTIATVKGLPRNAAMYLPPAPPANDGDDEDDEDEGEGEGDAAVQQAAPTNYLDLLKPFSEAIAAKVADMVPGLFVGAPANPVAAQPTEAAASSVSAAVAGDGLATRPFEARELFDLNYAHRKGEAKRAATQHSTTAVPLQARVMKDPQLVRQIVAIKGALAPDEIEALLSAVTKWPDEDQAKFLDTIKPLSVSEAIVFCREVISTIRDHQTGSESKEVD